MIHGRNIYEERTSSSTIGLLRRSHPADCWSTTKNQRRQVDSWVARCGEGRTPVPPLASLFQNKYIRMFLTDKNRWRPPSVGKNAMDVEDDIRQWRSSMFLFWILLMFFFFLSRVSLAECGRSDAAAGFNGTSAASRATAKGRPLGGSALRCCCCCCCLCSETTTTRSDDCRRPRWIRRRARPGGGAADGGRFRPDPDRTRPPRRRPPPSVSTSSRASCGSTAGPCCPGSSDSCSPPNRRRRMCSVWPPFPNTMTYHIRLALYVSEWSLYFPVMNCVQSRFSYFEPRLISFRGILL